MSPFPAAGMHETERTFEPTRGRRVGQAAMDLGRLGFSLATILFGWVVAVLLIPEIDYYQAGALMPAGLAMAFGLLAGAIYVAVIRPNALFRIEYLLMFGLCYWLVMDAAQGAYGFAGVSRATLVAAFAAIALFAISVWVGSFAMSYKQTAHSPAVVPVTVDARFLFIAAATCFLLGMLRVFLACRFSPVCIGSQLFVPRFESAWHLANIGNFDTMLMRLQYFGYLILPLTAALAHIERRLSWRVVTAGVLGLIFLLVLMQGGGRRQVGMVLGIAALVWVLLNRPPSWRELVVVILMAAVTFGVMQFMHTTRYQGAGEMRLQEQAGEVSYMTRERLIKVDKNLLFMSHIMERVPRYYPHTGFTGIEYALTAPIPRALYPSRPVQRGFPLTQILHLRVSPSWSWTASAIGDLYLIGGFLAVVAGGLFFGALADLGNRLLDRSNTVRNVMLYGVVALTLFIGLRALHEITISGFAIGAVWLVFYARRWFSRRRGHRSAMEP